MALMFDFPYFNPPSPCGEGRDPSEIIPVFDISIHPPRAGRDLFHLPQKYSTHIFQSTLPVRGGTIGLVAPVS